MKNIKNLGFLFTFLALFLMVSCEDEGGGGGGGGDEDFPQVSVGSTHGMDITANMGDTIFFTITATAGKDPMSTITVTEDGANLPLERVLYDGVSVANPRSLIGDDKNSFSTELGVIVSSDVATKAYQIIISDDGNRNVTTDFNITTAGLPPTLDFTSMMSGSIEINVGMSVSYPLDGTIGSSDLSTVSVYENGTLMDAARLDWNGTTPASNPITLDAEHAGGFTMVSLLIRASTEVGTNDYRIVLTDANGLESELTPSITTVLPLTPIDGAIMGVLFNQAGPTGTGGLDLDEGVGTGSMSTLAEIRDLGIDGDGNWLRKITTINDSQIKYVRPGMNGVSESFTFGGLAYKEELADLFANGVDYSSEVVVIGDLFSVVRDGKYYLIKIANIIETTGDNADKYEVDIKK